MWAGGTVPTTCQNGAETIERRRRATGLTRKAAGLSGVRGTMMAVTDASELALFGRTKSAPVQMPMDGNVLISADPDGSPGNPVVQSTISPARTTVRRPDQSASG